MRTLTYLAITGRPTNFLTVFSLLAVLLCVCYYRHLSRSEREMFWTSVAFCLLCSRLFPWHLLQGWLAVIQFPWRLFIFPEFLLDYLLAVVLTQYLRRPPYRFIAFIVCLVSVIGGSVIGQNYIVSQYHDDESLLPRREFHLPQKSGVGHFLFILDDNDTFNNLTHNTSNGDYYLKSVKPVKKTLLGEYARYGSHKHQRTQFFDLPNSAFQFDNTRYHEHLVIPYQDYRTARYHVLLNGRRTPYRRNRRGLMVIYHVPASARELKVVPLMTAYDWLSIFISLIGLGSYLYLAIERKRKH